MDAETGQALLSSEVAFPGWPQLETLGAQNIPFHLQFIVPNAFGVPGAIFVRNHHPNEFLLVSFTLDLPPDTKKIIHHAQYVTNSWVYNTDSTTNGRVFFRNKVKNLNLYTSGAWQSQLVLVHSFSKILKPQLGFHQINSISIRKLYFSPLVISPLLLIVPDLNNTP